ncbi:MAG TPA: ATP-binding cassette domain-containing protein, partial [Reyranella sp.]
MTMTTNGRESGQSPFTPVPPRRRIRTGALLETPPDAAAFTARAPQVQRQIVLDARNVKVSYGAKTAIAGVNLKIQRNVVTAIIGPSGCGKSTFL